MHNLWAWKLQRSTSDGVDDAPYDFIPMGKAADASMSAIGVAIMRFGRWRVVRGTSVDASKVNLMAASSTTSRRAISTVQGACATMDGSPEAMVGWLMERGLPMPSSVDGYCGHGEGVEDELFLVFLLVLAVISILYPIFTWILF